MLDAIEDEIRPYLSCAPGAVASAKALVRALGPRIDDAVIDQTIGELVERWETQEARERIAAFFAYETSRLLDSRRARTTRPQTQNQASGLGLHK